MSAWWASSYATSPESARPFGTQEIQLVETIAAQMGAAIENARLLEREAEEARLSGALNEINNLMHSSLDAAEIMRRVVAEAAKTVGADSVMIALKTATTGRRVRLP